MQRQEIYPGYSGKKKAVKLLKLLCFVVLAAVAFAVYANISVYKAGQTGVYLTKEAPATQVAIVLGARVYQSGSLSPVLADRLETGIELYKSGKVQKLLLTGDHGQNSYDEVNNMRKYALSRGVPEEDIFMDHAGFSTFDSLYRARDVFEVRKAIIVTQKFHLPRALFIGRSLGLQVTGVQADKRIYGGEDYLYFREIFARTKAVAELSLGFKPKYLGPAIPITGDGRATKDSRV